MAELAIFVIVIPLSLLAGRQSLLYSAPVASCIATFALGLIIARRVRNRRVLHGMLVGLVAVLIYVGMSLGRPEPIAYVVAHFLKVFGGTVGGYVARARAPGRPISGATIT